MRRDRVSSAAMALVFASVAMIAACADPRRSLGEACVKSDDCLSDVCSGQMCVTETPLLDPGAVDTPETDADVLPPYSAPDASTDAS